MLSRWNMFQAEGTAFGEVLRGKEFGQQTERMLLGQ